MIIYWDFLLSNVGIEKPRYYIGLKYGFEGSSRLIDWVYKYNNKEWISVPTGTPQASSGCLSSIEQSTEHICGQTAHGLENNDAWEKQY